MPATGPLQVNAFVMQRSPLPSVPGSRFSAGIRQSSNMSSGCTVSRWPIVFMMPVVV